MDDPIYKATDPEVLRANLAVDPGYRLICRECGKTPQDIGWCKDCGYNRPYDRVAVHKIQ